MVPLRKAVCLLEEQIRRKVREVVKAFPPGIPHIETDVERVVFQLLLLRRRVNRCGASLYDIGGGTSLFPAAAAKLGMEVTVIDSYEDVNNIPQNEAILKEVFPYFGITVIHADVVSDQSAFEAPESVDVFTCFDSMEHWHHSPRPALHSMMRALRKGGWLTVGMPNAVNLRKRLTVPLGKNNWSPLSEWYDRPRFQSHVREPRVDDLVYIAGDVGLEETVILGRNWAGYVSERPWIRTITPVLDKVLQLRPSLCSDLYLIGRKKK